MRDLNYNHLYYFWIVAREGSIARASQLLHLTPQTISGQIQLLEQSMQAKLFTRAGRGLALTDAGQVALHYADEIFRLGSELNDLVKGHSSQYPLPFSVGVVDVVPKPIAYRLLEPALHLPQPIRFVCREGKLETLLASLAMHRLDMILADTPTIGTNVRAYNHLLGECGISFFAAPALAEKLSADFPHSLSQAPLLLPASGTALNGALTHWLDQQGIRPRIPGEFEDSALMAAFGQAGAGVFIAPSVIAEEIVRQYQVRVIGHTDAIRERFYAISTERRLAHPALVAVSKAARLELFNRPPDTAAAAG